jgi:hypothetical protein
MTNFPLYMRFRHHSICRLHPHTPPTYTYTRTHTHSEWEAKRSAELKAQQAAADAAKEKRRDAAKEELKAFHAKSQVKMEKTHKLNRYGRTHTTTWWWQQQQTAAAPALPQYYWATTTTATATTDSMFAHTRLLTQTHHHHHHHHHHHNHYHCHFSEREVNFVKDHEALMANGTMWEKVDRLVHQKSGTKNVKSNHDRMDSLLIRLKNKSRKTESKI